MARVPRGLRNRNPLNIEYRPADDWRGLDDPPTDGRFCRFTAMEWGVRAAGIILRKYQTKHGLNTVEGVVRRWAPPVENNVQAYVAAVNQHAGFRPGQKLDLTDTATLHRLIRAMARHECGDDISNASTKAGISLMPKPENSHGAS